MYWQVRSLRGRLSRRLAQLNFLVLACASAVVFIVASMAFEDRQDELLEQKQWQLRSLLTDSQLSLHAGTLRHRIDDFLIGHPDMSLRFVLNDGQVLYDRPALLPSGHPRTLTFSMPAYPIADRVDITLGLETGGDRRVLHRIGLALMAATLGGGLLAALTGNLLVRKGLEPVGDLVNQIRDLTADTLDRKLDGSRQPEELEPLVDHFNRLLMRLSRAYKQLESFNADVAHELGTPLSTLIGNTELALRKARSPEELRLTLASNLEDLQRIAGIIRDMLFLSQADRGAQARRSPVPSLARIARQMIEFHEAAFEEAGLHVDLDGNAAGDFDVPLLQRALSNLLSNVPRYARSGSRVRVEISETDSEASIVVINHGETIPAAEQEAIFDRFYRVDRARAAGQLHHGLGLAIVAAIARMHGGRTVARSSNGKTAIGIILQRRGNGPDGSELGPPADVRESQQPPGPR